MEGGVWMGPGDMGNPITGPQKLKHLKQFDVPNVHEFIYLVLIWC